MTAQRRPVARAVLGLCLVAAVLLGLNTSGTRSSWTVARVTNPLDNAAVAILSYAHSVGGAGCAARATAPTALTSCNASVYPATAPSTSAAATNTVTNTGSVPEARVTARHRVASCGPVALANAVTGGTSGAMLPRVGTTFNPTQGPMSSSGSVTFDGTTGYASSVAATIEPAGPLIGTENYGLGIWFRTTSTSTSPMFSFSSNPLAGAGTTDRALYLDGAGRIGFVASVLGVSTPVGRASGAAAYNDGAWHFAYVSIRTARLVVGLDYTLQVFVDGLSVGTWNAGLLGSLTSYAGYWHLGRSSTTVGAGYFRGSLSGFLVDDSGAAPVSSTAKPTSYTSFAPTRTQQWRLDDSGGTFDGTTTGGTYTGTAYPSGVDPCTYVSMLWTLTNPAQTVTPASSTLRSMVTAGYRSTSAPPVGGAQSSVIRLTSAAPAASYAVGLILYAPVQSTYVTGSGSPPWQTSFTWNAPAAGTASGSTVVIG